MLLTSSRPSGPPPSCGAAPPRGHGWSPSERRSLAPCPPAASAGPPDACPSSPRPPPPASVCPSAHPDAAAAPCPQPAREEDAIHTYLSMSSLSLPERETQYTHISQ